MEISIIIPVYNAQRYLDCCINSIRKQSFENYELILINDGSTDRSGDICDKYAEMDERIYVIHQENKGVSTARNKGISRAKGNFIAFIDADDYIEKDYLKILYDDILQYNADIACCDYNELVDGICSNHHHAVRKNRVVRNIEEYVMDYLERREFYGYAVWGKLIRKDLLENQTFMQIQYGEDCVYMSQVFEKEPISVLNAYAGYNYICHSESATMAGKTEVISLQHIYCDEALVKLARLCNEYSVINRSVKRYAQSIYEALSIQIKRRDKDFFEDNYDIICKHINNVFEIGGIDLKIRFMLHFYKNCPYLYWYIVGILLKALGKIGK